MRFVCGSRTSLMVTQMTDAILTVYLIGALIVGATWPVWLVLLVIV